MVFPIYLNRHYVLIFSFVYNFKFFLASLDPLIDEIYVRWIFFVEVEADFVDEEVHELGVTLMTKSKEYNLLLLFYASAVVAYLGDLLLHVTD